MGLDCNILLHSVSGTFYNGSPVVGVVQMSLDEAMKIKDIVLCLTGNGHCRWTESRGIGKNRYIITLHGTEDYILTDVNLLQPENGESSLILKPGTYSYPFETQLPLSIPSSLEKNGASIRYAVNVSVKRPWKWDLKFSTTFTVISQHDLYSMPTPTTINVSLVKKFTNLFSSTTGEMCLKLRSPSSAYLPGQTIQLQYLLQNKSSVEVKCLKAKLVEIVTLISNTNDCHTRRQLLSKVSSKELCHKKVNTMFLEIPYNSTPMLRHCNIIKVDYYIEVKVKVSGIHTSPTTMVPVIIINTPSNNSTVSFDESWDMNSTYSHGGPSLSEEQFGEKYDPFEDNSEIAKSQYNGLEGPSNMDRPARDLNPPSYDEVLLDNIKSDP